MNKNDQIAGCIFGGAIGDAFGGHYENNKPPIVFTDEHEMLLSDDTQLTLATCESIAFAGRVDPSHICTHFAEWYASNRLRGLGASTKKALEELD